MEDKIAEQVASLGEIVKDALSFCRGSSTIVRGPSGQIWRNFTYEYAAIDKDDLLQEMKRALKEMRFQPPRRVQ